ncbi:MAG: single-stranded DNA-binding protein [Candidatus Desulforudis sp.]|nr:single-stranded DNA-binding protein [Desulforudis sp.]
MFNKTILIGRLVRDPELNHTPNGTPVTKFTLAVDRGYTNSEGQKQTDFIDIVVWRKQAESVAKHMAKGRLVTVEGRLEIRSYEDSQGIRRKAAEVIAQRVVFMPDGKRNGGGIEEPPFPDEPPFPGEGPGEAPPADDDDFPF